MTDRDTRQFNRYAKVTTPDQAKTAMAEALASFTNDPLGFVRFLFPWGVKGSALEREDGPDEWQREELESIGQHLRDIDRTMPEWTPYRGTTASGHGIGKSAQTSWLILWSTMTLPDARGVATANSDTQLRTKTWAELAKWWELACGEHPILRELFELTATAFYQVDRPKTWRTDAIPNNPRNPAAFAGLHNAGKRVTVIIDEASEIEDPIWDTVEGALTDNETEILLLAFGNPTKNTGRFKENTTGRFRHLWRSRQIDGRKVKRTNKALLQSWVDAWGEDSDFVRVRVRGVFPRVGSMQLIPTDLVEQAQKREPSYIPSDPIIMGLDIARFGDDASVLRIRRGRDAKTFPKKVWRGTDTMTLAGAVAQEAAEIQPDAIFVDVGGVGAGVYDRLVQLRVKNVYPVEFGSSGGTTAMNGIEARCANKRAAMYVDMREWLRLGAIDPADSDLEQDLIGIEYGFNGDNAILLESKESMKKRGLSSPDDGDALALTFAFPIPPRNIEGFSNNPLGDSGVQTEYDPYAELR